MSEAPEETPIGEPHGEAHDGDGLSAFHLLLDADEVPVTRTALELLIDDAAHESDIRGLARATLVQLPQAPEASSAEWPLSIPLEPGEMKILHTALRLLLDDLQRGQDDEIQILHAILGKLPDEHAIRAIQID